MLALKDRCIHPRTNKPYIKTSIGGADTSPEELQVLHPPQLAQHSRVEHTKLTREWRQDGSTHVFVCEFDSPEDRRYYLEEDPEYSAFAESINGIVERRRVVDFEPGEFSSRMR